MPKPNTLEPVESGNVNQNLKIPVMEIDYQGKKLIKVLSVSIGEDTAKSYICVNEDGDKVEVPASIIEGAAHHE